MPSPRRPNRDVVATSRDRYGDPALCTCNHGAEFHTLFGTGRCAGPRDSYGQPCSCPAFEYDPNRNADADDDDLLEEGP